MKDLLRNSSQVGRRALARRGYFDFCLAKDSASRSTNDRRPLFARDGADLCDDDGGTEDSIDSDLRLCGLLIFSIVKLTPETITERR